MKTLYQSLLVAIGALALAGVALAQVPSTNDTSTTDGNQNTGMGTGALGGPNPVNLTGNSNTASGFEALLNNTAGGDNTAAGDQALKSNTTGNNNTAAGVGALSSNTDGNANTASGFIALSFNTTGNENTASGFAALEFNTTGNYNTASGFQALSSSTTSSYNTASGFHALLSNTIGNNNTAFGTRALQTNTTGSGNIAVGFQAGFNLTTGSHNIDVGSTGVAAESNTIRIGSATQKATFIAGIFGTPLTGSPVVVSSNGQLGVTASSARYKTSIAPMGANTAKLAQLRPVTFHLRTDPHGALQYGLIAEEVAKVYPDLVIRNDKGRIDGIRYDELAPMLLNEMQQQRAQMTDEMRDLKQQVAELKALNQATQVALQKLQAKDELVAQR